MKSTVRYIGILLLLATTNAVSAQTTSLLLDDMYQVSTPPLKWKYNTVICNSGNKVTSVILSMVNNDVTLGGSPSPAATMRSLGKDPLTILYLFPSGITAEQVVTFIKGMTFTQTNDVSGADPSMTITIDANPTHLPTNATITLWDKHPDGTPHYYLFVAGSIQYAAAYNAAKSYYFQGMRGYLPTITSDAENQVLTNISEQQGWSGGVRTTSTINDTRNPITNPVRSNSGIGNDYRWICGPETNFYYYKGPTRGTSGSGNMNNSFNAWNTGEPNDSYGENCMQVNFSENLLWNDYSATQANIQGYFIEFGGSGEAYSVQGYATYPANEYALKYKMPTVETTNDQWHGFSPGNRASSKTTFKANVMRSNVLIIE